MPEGSEPKILVMTGNYHFGNKPGLFQDAPFVGKTLVLPVVITYVDASAPDVILFFETHDIETWGTWNGHRVLLNGQQIGALKDPADVFGRTEIFRLIIPMKRFLEIIDHSAGLPTKADLQLVLEVQPAHPALADDFVLTRIDTGEQVVMQLGA